MRFVARLAVLLVAAAVVYLVLRHRVSNGSLAHSVAAETTGYADGCLREGRRRECSARDSSGGNGYRVTLDGHCWTAVRRRGVAGGGGSRADFPRRLEGCIDMWDQLRLDDRIDVLD